jgi:FtsP/CotA-like multicopper oxidase with cupredoxin domain
MKFHTMKKTRRGTFKLSPVTSALLLALAAQVPANLAYANAAFGENTDVAGNMISVPTYFASSPSGTHPAYDPVAHKFSATVTVDTGKPLRKFVDSIGGAYNGLGNPKGMTDLQAGIPVAMQEHNWFNTANGQQTQDDYLELAMVEYTEQMHSDLANPTRLRGYVQIETAAQTNGAVDASGVLISEHIEARYPDGNLIKDAAGKQVYFVHKPHYLGPVIVATKGTPMRIKLTNYLPYTNAQGVSVGTFNLSGGLKSGGDLPIPVDETIPGGGPVLDGNGAQIYVVGADGKRVQDANNHDIPVKMGQNRVSIHWHGGDTPWISDGTPHQWIAPAGDISYTLGRDANHPFGMGKGDSSVGVPDMAPPGDGEYTFYFPNNLSGRLMFYHDHTYGLTRLNVYEGVAAGYVVKDPVEQAMVAKALSIDYAAAPGGLNTGLLDTIGIPLVFQDKGFVPKNMGAGAMASDGTTPQSQDAKWDIYHWGQEGDLFFPHVYETNQDPNSIDGTNPVGRWDWGPWFWPVFPAQYSLPSGNYGDVTTTPEAFMDTATVNGKVYPTMTVDPKAYRLRILSASNDRALNLSLYQAVDSEGNVCVNGTTPKMPGSVPPVFDQKGVLVTPGNGYGPNGDLTVFPGGSATVVPAATDLPASCTEVKMVPALPTPGFPANWPTDGRVGGVPDPATAGPDFVQIGSEGGLLPAPAVWPAQPTTYETDVRSITVFNVSRHGLLVAPAERADVLVDFTKYAGKTLIVYNDAPAPMPGFDPRIDYYTGMGDNTAAGGAYDVAPGYGPNTRTFMQIKVNAAITPGTTGSTLDVAALASAMPAAYAATQPAPIIPEAAYNAPFGKAEINNYAAIGTGSGALNSGLFSYTENGTPKTLPVINKAIQELFDPIYGRMNATLAVELPFSTATVATTIPLSYIDHPEERLDAIKDGETQIWKITHNGVDDHPVHFHLVNVQVINRVGWDGTIKPPEANELGWKETLRMNPLEDVYVAVKASRPVAPFGLPTSSRLLDPASALNSQVGFTQIDPTTGQAPNQPYANVVTDFDNEYVWHCHILGHEEFDFMRPMVFHPTVVVPDAPTNVTVTGNTITWTDPTPYGGVDSQGIPTAGTVAFMNGMNTTVEPTGNAKNEIGFRIKDVKGNPIGTALANQTTWTDATGVLNLAGATVVAYNAAGDSALGVAPVAQAAPAPVAAPIVSGTAPAVTGPAGPTGLGVTGNAGNKATLSWTGVAGAIGYQVNGAAVASTCDPVTGVCTASVTGLAAGNNTFNVTATTLNGTTTAATIGLYNGKAYAPVALIGVSNAAAAINGLPRSAATLTWANDPRNTNNVTGLTLTWVEEGKSGPVGTATFAPGNTGTTVVGLTRGLKYIFSLVATSLIGNSTQSSIQVVAR